MQASCPDTNHDPATPLPANGGPREDLLSRPRSVLLFITAVAALLFAIRLAAPSNLMDQDQERPASYVLDVVKNGHWLCQRDWLGDITSKPPLYTWLCSLVALSTGSVSRFALYLPGALAGLGAALLLFRFGQPVFGTRAACIGAIASMLTTAGAKQFGLARTDGVFAFTVTLGALLAWRAWTSGKGWTWFWLAAAAASLTKGPLGLLLAAGGLLAVFWERKSGDPLPLRGSHWLGVICFLAIVGGWFALAYWQVGEALTAKMLGKELVGHVVASEKRHLPGTLLWQPPLYYLGRAAPWSLVAYYGLWRIWRRPSPDATQRRYERFLFCWFTGGLLLFSLAPHQRADLLWPLMPAAALIAGLEIDRAIRPVHAKRFAALFALGVAAALVGFGLYYFVSQPRARTTRQTLALKAMADEVRSRGGIEFPLSHVDSPMTLQIYLQTLRPYISPERAVALLRGQEPAFVAVTNPAVVEALRTANDRPWHRLSQTPGFVRHKAVTLLSNQTELKPLTNFVLGCGPWNIKALDAKLLRATATELWFQPATPGCQVEIRNDSRMTNRVRVRMIPKEGPASTLVRDLGPAEVWRVSQA